MVDYFTRKAQPSDDLRRIALLIYDTDPFIYPFWFEGRAQGIDALEKMIRTPGNLFSLENIFVLLDRDQCEILGVIVAIHQHSRLDYDYSGLKQFNHHYRFTIENYVEPSVAAALQAHPETIIITNCCIDARARGLGCGKALLHDFMELAKEQGFMTIELDCLAFNDAALALYRRCGFQTVVTGIGFDGTDHSQVPIVTMSCQIATIQTDEAPSFPIAHFYYPRLVT